MSKGSPPRTWGRCPIDTGNGQTLGSPPRTWGRWLNDHDFQPGDRFTPTHVGKICRRDQGRCFRKVHPHARGEDLICMEIDLSSPRFTPTHVGKMCGSRPSPVPRQVHPHARGEDSRVISGAGAYEVHPHARGEDDDVTTAQIVDAGSPPRTWGRCGLAFLKWSGYRFTPTHVGKMLCPVSRHPTSSVHPHARGEDNAKSERPSHVVGSPPRTWGRCRLRAEGQERSRFTPTHVGKMYSAAVLPILFTVHPHARGEDAGIRVWSNSWQVHPHARGEDCGVVILLVSFLGSPPRTWGRSPVAGDLAAHHGSPPRTWGRLRPICCGVVPTRFTPTHVGKIRKCVEL